MAGVAAGRGDGLDPPAAGSLTGDVTSQCGRSGVVKGASSTQRLGAKSILGEPGKIYKGGSYT